MLAATGSHSFQTLSAGEPGSGYAPKDLRVDTRFHRGTPHIYRGLTPVSTLCQPFPTWGTPAPRRCAVSPAPTETSPPPASAGCFPTCSGSRCRGCRTAACAPVGNSPTPALFSVHLQVLLALGVAPDPGSPYTKLPGRPPALHGFPSSSSSE